MITKAQWEAMTDQQKRDYIQVALFELPNDILWAFVERIEGELVLQEAKRYDYEVIDDEDMTYD